MHFLPLDVRVNAATINKQCTIGTLVIAFQLKMFLTVHHGLMKQR